MANFVYIYYGTPQFTNPDEAKQNQVKWGAWADSLGSALVNRGIPIGTSKTVSSNGVVNEPRTEQLTGFTIVQADSMDRAIEMLKGCPYLEYGTIDVAEAFSM